MSLSTQTGNPPAVTHEQIEAWTKLADDIAAALAMGGEAGLDLLTGIMAEWSEAVDDVNTARQVCVDLASKGRRHEAIHWHAENFFDLADRLDPERPGWEAWEQSLRARGIVTPRMDPELKELANRIHEDLEQRDLGGRSLGDHLVDLRRNMLLRGHLGERLVTLEAIRGLDPSPQIWRNMISPIRRRRVDVIADEVAAAIARRDYEALESLRAEVASQDWGDDLPASVSVLLESTAGCEGLSDLKRRLGQATATVVGRVEEARRQIPESPGCLATIEVAKEARAKFHELRNNLVASMKAASATPEASAIVEESGVRDALRQFDEAVREPGAWLDKQQEMARIRAAAAEIEAKVLRVIEKAPEMSGEKEVFQRRLKEWKQLAEQALEKYRKRAARLPGGVPDSTAAMFQRLQATRQEHEDYLKGLQRREKTIVAAFIIGLFVVVLLLIMGVIVTVMLQK
jgi:hypothetical protein